MPSGETPRRKLKFPKATDADKFCTDIEALSNQLDNDAETAQGKESERSAASLRGRLFMTQGDATAAKNGIMWWDSGSTWLPLQSLVAEGQTYKATPATITELAKEELSAVRSGLVTATVEAGGEGGGAYFYIVKGGEKLQVGFVFATKNAVLPVHFLVPPAWKWEWEKYSLVGAVLSVKANWILL